MQRMNQKEWTVNPMDWVFLALMIIGGLNWGLVGLFNFDLVATVFGSMTVISRVVYTAVGFSAVWSIVALATHLHQRTFATHSEPGVVAH